MLSSAEVKSIFESCGALLSGHFLLTSGLHSPQYLEKFRVLQFPELTSRLCGEIARRFSAANIQLVVGPATGGIILAHEVGRQLGVRAVFTEREGGVMKLRRGFAIAPEERVLIVEDIVTTGGSVKEVVQIVQDAGAEIIGVALLCDRSNGALDIDVRTESLMELTIATSRPEDCPQCRDGIPLTERGSRHL
jgi:orotate phosphoribosyltransferase